jgi:hypothetical protein
MTKYRLEMNEKQARVTVAALDFSMRVWLGQWREIIECCMKFEPEKLDEWCERRDEAETVLLQARKIIMPELTGCGHSYGVYNRPETERLYNVLLAVRSCLAYHEHPEGGYTVNFRKPMAIHVNEEMPKCEVVDDGKGRETADEGAN